MSDDPKENDQIHRPEKKAKITKSKKGLRSRRKKSDGTIERHRAMGPSDDESNREWNINDEIVHAEEKKKV